MNILTEEERIEQLQAENAELKAIIHDSAKFVIPGEVDTSGAFLLMLREVRSERDQFNEKIKGLEAELKRLNVFLERARGALDSSSETCVELSKTINDLKRENEKLRAERDQARAACAEYREALENASEFIQCIGPHLDEVKVTDGVDQHAVYHIRHFKDQAQAWLDKALSTPNPGSALLKELEAARHVVEAAKKCWVDSKEEDPGEDFVRNAIEFGEAIEAHDALKQPDRAGKGNKES